ncbi:hypothetical protein [Macrococcus sp. DPC7161]|uniref:hypothetical protein n=1 Tax=Macrococcus sp. DPC7161 TaxID=2507060 RepID=UPI0013E91340|nr:hypothetical protein [Macrococcus sp. DPC7161]
MNQQNLKLFLMFVFTIVLMVLRYGYEQINDLQTIMILVIGLLLIYSFFRNKKQ